MRSERKFAPIGGDTDSWVETHEDQEQSEGRSYESDERKGTINFEGQMEKIGY